MPMGIKLAAGAVVDVQSHRKIDRTEAHARRMVMMNIEFGQRVAEPVLQIGRDCNGDRRLTAAVAIPIASQIIRPEMLAAIPTTVGEDLRAHGTVHFVEERDMKHGGVAYPFR
ncbi:hypothetical protein GCM10007856_24910 [Azospirillum oryzae]|nr:hypothetical protein GCM10007856_24910 [Azospirillum oryzae]